MKATWWERLRCNFDNVMSKGVVAKISLLGMFSILVILVIFGLSMMFDHGDNDAWKQLWITIMRTFDPGNLNGDEESYPGILVFFMLIATLFGMFFMATLIGIINNGLENYMDMLNRGRSRVLETGHTIILGTNEIGLSILGELFEANMSEKKKTVVILSPDHEKQELEEIIRARFHSWQDATTGEA